MRNWIMSLGLAVTLAIGLGAHCNPGPVVTGVLNCETAAVKSALPDLLPIVASLLAGGGNNAMVDAALLGLAEKFGLDSLDCAVQAVIAVWAAAADHPEQVNKLLPTFDAKEVAKAALRGQAWLKSRGKAPRTVKVQP